MKQKELKLTTKISMAFFLLTTILSFIFFVIGILTIDTPNTAAPEIMLILSMAWGGFLIYCGD